tara:strand:+ start:232 stop:774 length:543 start_codon:yes stop_codon:yes gene_type:complete
MSSLRNNYSKISNQRKLGLGRSFTLEGDGVTIDALGDYSAAPVDFFVQPPPNFDFYLSEIILELSDNSGLTRSNYGGISELPVGIKTFVLRNGVRIPGTNPEAIKNNGGLIINSSSFEVIPFSGSTQTLLFRLKFSETAEPTYLNGNNGDRFGITLNDDFTGLSDHQFAFLGYTQGPKSV